MKLKITYETIIEKNNKYKRPSYGLVALLFGRKIKLNEQKQVVTKKEQQFKTNDLKKILQFI